MLNPNCYDDQVLMAKFQLSFFDPQDIEDQKTRTSTFSKTSNGREEIQKHEAAYYQAFVHHHAQNSFNGFMIRPIDTEE